MGNLPNFSELNVPLHIMRFYRSLASLPDLRKPYLYVKQSWPTEWGDLTRICLCLRCLYSVLGFLMKFLLLKSLLGLRIFRKPLLRCLGSPISLSDDSKVILKVECYFSFESSVLKRFCKKFLLFFFCFCFLWLHPQHVEVPRLGVEWEVQPPACTTATATRDQSHICDLHHSSQQRRILNPLSEARDQIHILIDPSQVC